MGEEGALRRWLDAGWRADVVEGVSGELAALDIVASAPPEQPHVRPWSTVLRSPPGADRCGSRPGASYQRAFLDLSAPDRAPYASAVPGWLAELLEPTPLEPA